MAVIDAPARPDLGLPPPLENRPAATTQSGQANQPGQANPRPLPVVAASTPAATQIPYGGPQAPRPTRPKVSFGAMRAMHALLARNPVWTGVARWIESHEKANEAFTAAEKAVKEKLFGCRMCGQCALPSTAYACPMTCPKQLRNGPCGGVAFDGSCEVYPGMRCVWLMAYERADQDGRVADLRRLQRPIDQRTWGQSSWVNYWLGRDEGLWTKTGDIKSNRIELPMLPSQARR